MVEIQRKHLELGPASIDSGDSNSSFADPGVFSLKISNSSTKTELNTSVAWVEQERNELAAMTKQFAQIVRDLAEVLLCGNAPVYGIDRHEEHV